MTSRNTTRACALWCALAMTLSACGNNSANNTNNPANNDTSTADMGQTGANTTTPDMPGGGVEPLAEYATLSAPVEVVVDDIGLPHIYAQNDLDLFFAAGYWQASERIYALEVNRRTALGRMSELIGEEAEGGDIQAKVLGFERWAIEGVAAMAANRPADHNLLIAFVGGINRHIAELQADPSKIPPQLAALGWQPEPYAAKDLLAIGNRIQFGFSNTLEFDLLNTVTTRVGSAAEINVFQPGDAAFFTQPGQTSRRGFRQQGLEGTTPPRQGAGRELTEEEERELKEFLDAIQRFQAYFGIMEGSNAWGVTGEHTFNGRPILANDSHAQLADPNLMYITHLNSADAGGSFDVIGFGFVGIPAIQLGHNREIAWAATTNFADIMDLWDVSTRNEDTEVNLGGDWVATSKRTDTYQVKLEDGSLEERTVEVIEVPGTGVLLPSSLLPVPKALIGVRGELLLGWPGFQALTELFMFFDLDRASTLDDFKAAISMQKVGLQSWEAATKDGLSLFTNGTVPDRGPAENRPRANTIMDGSDPNNLWTRGFLPGERFARLDDLPYIYSANNDPWGHTADGDPLNDEFYYGSFFAAGYRAGRLDRELDRLIGEGKVDVEQTKTLQRDVFSPLADALVPLLVDAAAEIPTNEDLAEWRDDQAITDAVASLETWDRFMTTDSAEGLVFRVWAGYLSRAVVSDELALLFDIIDGEEPVLILKYTHRALEDEDMQVLDRPAGVLMLTALARALETIDQRGWMTWGDLHDAQFTDPLRATEFATRDGSDSAINVSQGRCWDGSDFGERCASGSGSVFRTITTFTEDGTPETIFNWPKGNVSTTQNWIDGTYERWWFTRAEVDAHTERTVTLEP